MAKTNTQHSDLLVIGAGSGGVRAARLAATGGAAVTVVEAGPLGGTCVNLGCIPKKLLYYASHFAHDIADARHYGWGEAAAGAIDWPGLLQAKDGEISRLNGVYRQLLQTAGARIVAGRAQLLGGGKVEVGGDTLTADKILLATGSRAVGPKFPGSDMLLMSDDIFHLPQLPQRIVVIGGGYIASEFAGIFAGMGRQTSLVYRRSPLLRGFDDELREHVTGQIALKGVQLHLDTQIDRLERRQSTKSEFRLHLQGGAYLDADLVMAATGRTANTTGLGLEAAQVATDEAGNIRVDEHWQTSTAGIYAIGDVIGTPQLTPLAIAQAVDFYRQMYEGKERRLDYEAIPTAVFCQPSIGTVGLTEDEAVQRLGEVRVYGSNFRELKDTLTGSEEKMLIKLVVDAATDRVVGAHVVGGQAGEMIQGIALGVRNRLTKAQFDDTLAVHPTAAEEFVTLSGHRAGRRTAAK